MKFTSFYYHFSYFNIKNQFFNKLLALNFNEIDHIIQSIRIVNNNNNSIKDLPKDKNIKILKLILLKLD